MEPNQLTASQLINEAIKKLRQSCPDAALESIELLELALEKIDVEQADEFDRGLNHGLFML